MRKFIIFLISRKLGVKRYQEFQFTNQKSNDIYYFTEINLMKKTNCGYTVPSRVSLNWIMDKDCKATHPVYRLLPLKESVNNGD